MGSIANLTNSAYYEAAPPFPDYGHYPSNDASQRPLHVVITGLGISGIAMAIELKKLPHVTFEVFEKNPDVGGTWFENRYLGAACDIASHAYQYTFAWNPNWSSHFSPSREIFQYYRAVAEKFDVLRHVHFNTSVTEANWNEAAGKWIVRVSNDGNSREVVGDAFINASGILNNWRWPDIEGLHDFKGKLMHTANWDDSHIWKGEKVALIGSGASGVQVLPPLREDAEHVKFFVRSPAYILPLVGLGAESSEFNEKYPEETKERLRTDKEYYLKFRKGLEEELNKNFIGLRKNSDMQKETRKAAEEMMRKFLKREDLQEKLIPNFEIFCRRITPSRPFLQAVQEDNVEVISDRIVRIVPEGLQTADGQIHRVDSIICATGFDTSFTPRFPLRGKNGLDLQKLWSSKPAEGYLGVSVAGFPNYWSFLGPNCPIANSSLVPCIEYTAKYIVQVLQKIQREQIKSVTVKRSVEAAFNSYAQALHKDLVWTGGCKSWYKDASGRVIAVWPGSGIQFIETIETPRYEHYDIDYIDGHPFAFLGDGRSQREVSGEDLTWYLEDVQYLEI